MKLTKKVLSVFLAVVMALSCFGVAASALGDPDNSIYNASLVLKSTVGSIKWTSKTKFTQNDPGNPVEGDITAEPGDTVFVYMYAGADYYIHTIAAQVWYSAGLLDYKESLAAATGASGTALDFSVANQKKLYPWNTSNYLVETYGVGDADIINPWSVIAPGARVAVEKAWPTSDDGKLLPEYDMDNDGVPDIDRWHWTRISKSIKMDSPCGVMLTDGDEEVHLIKFPLQVPADAAPGTVYTVTIPDESLAREAKWTAFNRISEIGIAEGYEELDENGKIAYSEDFEGGPFDVKAYTSNNFEYTTAANGKTQYFDVSRATFHITVAGEPVAELDYSALEAEVATSAALNVANATDATKTPFQTALANAQAMVASKDAADQAAIDALTSALASARAALKYKANYSDLDSAIALAGTKVEADYTRASWNDMQTALTAANNVARDLTSDAQATINAAATALNNAITALVPVSGANYSALDTAIALAGTKVQAHYTTGSWAAMQTALTAANNVARDLTSEDQYIIDEATTALNTAITGLVEADADYTALNEAKTLAATKVQGDYTAETWSPFQTAYTAAQNVATGLKAKDQGIIDAAKDALVEAMGKLVALGGADYSEIDTAIAAEPAYAQSFYKEDAWSAYQTALTAAQNVDRNLKENQQYIVDNAKNNLVTAFNALANNLKDADYSAVDAAIADFVNNYQPTSTNYTTESLQAYVAARDAVVRGKKINEQAIVDAYADAIEEAIINLQFKNATTTPLTNALTNAEAQVESLYTPASWAVLADAVAAGNALLAKTPLDIRDNAAIVEAANAITTAITNLVPLGADYRELTAQKARYEALNTAWYTTATMSAATTAYNAAVAVPADLTLADQDRIDTAATALKNAIDALEEKDADYTALDAAVTAANKKVLVHPQAHMQNYTQDSWDAFQAILATADSVRGLKISQQATVDAKAAEINDAITNVLVWAPFDYTQTNYELGRLAALDEDDYTPASWAAAQTAADGIVWDLDMSSVNKGMANMGKLQAAINRLALAPAADYSEVTAAQNAAAALNAEDYTAETWAVLEAALEAVVTGLNSNHQSEVDAMADAINEAIDGLEDYVAPVDPADYTALDAALADAAALTASDWTADTWAALAAAVADGNAVSRELTADEQATVDAAAQAITDAIAALVEYVAPVEPANYEALDAALAAAAALTEADWTAETWADLEAAVAEGNALSRELTADDQATVDAAAQAITDAIDALEAYVAPVVNGIVSGVDFTAATAGKNTFEITVQGRPSMIQFVELDHQNGTRSFDRYHNNVTVVSYDAEGNVVNSLDPALAYEVWTVETNLDAGNTALRAKSNASSTWEALDDAYNFKYELKALNSGLVSAELAATEGDKIGSVATTIVVGPEAKAVQLKFADGSTATYAAEKASGTDDNGNLIFNKYAWATQTGENVITVRILDANGWTVATTLTYTVNA